MSTILKEKQLRNLITQILVKAGVSGKQTRAVTDALVWNELVGRSNFGVVRLPTHLKRLNQGLLNPLAVPRFAHVSQAAALLDADNGFGYYAGQLAMKKAISLAEQNGIGAVSVRNSNFYGTGAYFVQQAARKRMIGLSFSNSYPKVAAYKGRNAVLGTNPFAFSAPRANGRSLLVDFATSSIAGSTIREYIEKGKLLPEGLAVGKNGSPGRDPAKIQKGSLLPFGGPKGFGLSIMVEIFSGVLSGGGFSHGVKSNYNLSENVDCGHFFLALDVSRWMNISEFFDRLEALVSFIEASDPDGEVDLPGNNRWRNFLYHKKNGILIDGRRDKELSLIAKRYKLSYPI